MNNNEICIPANAVANAGTSPAAGDEIEVNLKGKVTRLEGGQLYFTATSANGQPIAGEESEEPTEESLRARAEEEDAAGVTG